MQINIAEIVCEVCKCKLLKALRVLSTLRVSFRIWCWYKSTSSLIVAYTMVNHVLISTNYWCIVVLACLTNIRHTRWTGQQQSYGAQYLACPALHWTNTLWKICQTARMLAVHAMRDEEWNWGLTHATCEQEETQPRPIIVDQAARTSNQYSNDNESTAGHFVTINAAQDFVVGCETFHFTGWNQWVPWLMLCTRFVNLLERQSSFPPSCN